MNPKDKYKTNWYYNREFIVIEIPNAKDIDFMQELLHTKGIHFDYRGLNENGNNIIIIFKDNI